MTKLNDLQLILLTTAAQREDGNLVPLPESAAKTGARARTALQGLLTRGLAAEASTSQLDRVWREEDERRVTLVLTAAGRAAIGLDPADASNEAPMTSKTPSPPSDQGDRGNGASKEEPKSGSKKAQLLEMLQRAKGASIGELVHELSWLPHTTRAAVTGLRKAGHMVEKSKVDGVTRYHIAGAQG